VPARFSWVDQRLVRDRHLDRLSAQAAALYLFLITVADAQGLSWYGDASTARRLSIDEERLRRARADLVHAGLLAYAKPLYQVLALGDPLPSPVSAPLAAAGTDARSAPAAPATENAVVQERIKALHTALGRRP
jgi:hypothetical protein